MPKKTTDSNNPIKPSHPAILLTIDVEDWFQVENFKQYIPFSSWSNRELRVEKNVHRLLDLFDSIKVKNSYGNDITNSSSGNQEPGARNQKPEISIRTTFFVLGWIAERLPRLIREIHQRGHELGSHGFSHFLCSKQKYENLKTDLKDSKKLLEDISGFPVLGYRAPSFAINNNVVKIIEDCGYLYDSSFNSFNIHHRYGWLDLSANGNKGIAIRLSEKFYELPISNFRLGRQILPWGGGAYFRLIPSYIFGRGVRSILKRENAYLFYLHPWEVDPGQPRLKQASIFSRFRHYTYLDKTTNKLSSFMESFKGCCFISCCQYLKEQLATHNP